MTPAEFTRWREALGGRRFWMTVGAGIVDTFLRYIDAIDISAYVTLTLGTIAVYIAGNTAQKVKTNVQPDAEIADPSRGAAGPVAGTRGVSVPPGESL